jgi:hypothetical protein
MKKPTVLERRPRILELCSSRECCVNFRLEFDDDGLYPSITGSIGERNGDRGDWQQVFYIPLGRGDEKIPGLADDLEQSALILEQIAAHLRREGKKILDGLDDCEDD